MFSIYKRISVLLAFLLMLIPFSQNTVLAVSSSNTYLNKQDLSKICKALIKEEGVKHLAKGENKNLEETSDQCVIAGRDAKSGLLAIYVSINEDTIIGVGYNPEIDSFTQPILLNRKYNTTLVDTAKDPLNSQDELLFTIVTTDDNKLSIAIDKTTGKQRVISDSKHVYKIGSEFQKNEVSENAGGKLYKPEIRPLNGNCANVCGLIGILSCAWTGPAGAIMCGLLFLYVCNWICDPTPVY